VPYAVVCDARGGGTRSPRPAAWDTHTSRGRTDMYAYMGHGDMHAHMSHGDMDAHKSLHGHWRSLPKAEVRARVEIGDGGLAER
jgi:hypothetical protein